jgi:CheY-like chemotaxis protein
MSQKKFSILIADDDLEDQELIKMAIREVNCVFEVSSVYNGIQLMDYVRKQNVYKNIEEDVDLLLLDLNMPKMDGFDVLAAFKADEKLRRIPIFIFSSSNNEKDIERALRLGATRFYTKPTDLGKYKEIMEEVCDICLTIS